MAKETNQDEGLQGVLRAAADGALDSWANVVEYRHNQIVVRNRHEPITVTITLDTVTRGVTNAACGKGARVSRAMREMARALRRSGAARPGHCRLNADAAGELVQLGLYGNVIYPG